MKEHNFRALLLFVLLLFSIAVCQLQQTILSILAYLNPRMLTVGNVDKVLDEDGEVINPEFQIKLDEFSDSYLAFVSKF